ncbi:hypothetical protein ACB098_05G110400 [Castanea mollissima]
MELHTSPLESEVWVGCMRFEHIILTKCLKWSCPKACAAILWKSAKAAPQAAETLRITATELCKLQIADDVIPVNDPFFILCSCFSSISYFQRLSSALV